MKVMRRQTLAITSALVAVSLLSSATGTSIQTVEDYNKMLPFWGVSWAPGAGSTNGYYPSFYTGFAMRSQSPERIHVRIARGNQTRLSVILDDQTIADYLFDLVGRRQFYARMTTGSGAKLNIQPASSSFLPQLSYFNQVIDSPIYGINDFVARAQKGLETKESIHQKSIEVLSALNKGRVFNLKINLQTEFLKWKAQMLRISGGDANKILSNPNAVIVALNGLVQGRVNFTDKPSAEIMNKLAGALGLALSNANETELVNSCFELLKLATGSKYQFQTLNEQGKFVPALQCTGSACELRYNEFTALYPTGSVMEATSDEFGNRVNFFATQGLWNFVERPGRSDVDNIRSEPFYGFAPKMDFEDIGNGFHNPAVRFFDPSKDVKNALGISSSHNTLWAVKRGGVSHGCLRLPLGHVWEMRHIFPVESAKMAKILYFGNQSQDFDVFDINGDGKLEVMGVEYFISYGLQGTDGLARREGTDLEISTDKKHQFYTQLYGERNIFTVDSNNRYVFQNPRISVPSYLDYKKKSVSTRVVMNGAYPLYEQAYEQDKTQFYSIGGDPAANKTLVRLMGRVRACAPTSDKQACGQAAFENEAKGILR